MIPFLGPPGVPPLGVNIDSIEQILPRKRYIPPKCTLIVCTWDVAAVHEPIGRNSTTHKICPDLTTKVKHFIAIMQVRVGWGVGCYFHILPVAHCLLSLHKAPTEYTKPLHTRKKPRQTIQSPGRLYKAPRRLYKAPKRSYKDLEYQSLETKT